MAAPQSLYPHALLLSLSWLGGIQAVAASNDRENIDNNSSFELMFYAGGGNQWHTRDQRNTAYGADLNVYRYPFSEKQTLFLGVGITQLNSNTDEHQQLLAFTIYPQLNLTLPSISTLEPFFYVRTLAPTYITETQLGERQQANHFVFQSQIGLGAYFGERHQWQVNLSYRHYSNANLAQPNDGIDATTLLTLGRKL